MIKSGGTQGALEMEQPAPVLFSALSLQAGDQAHLLLDSNGRILSASGRCRAILGRDADDLYGRTIAELSAVDSEPATDRWLTATLSSGFGRRDTRLHRPDGSFVDVELALSRPVDADSQLICSLHDITERRRRERSMREESEGYRAVFDHALDAMLALDDDGRVVHGNFAARELFALDDAAFLGCPFASLLLEDDAARFVARWPAVLDMGEERGQSRLRPRDGLSRHVDYAIRAHYKLGHHLVALRDVTARDELERQLRRAQKLEALGRLAGGVAHDFNNLLTAVLVSADVLLEDMGDDPVHATDLHVIRDAANRASALTRQLLSFGRQQWSAVRTFDLHAVVTESTVMLHRLMGSSIVIESAIGTGPYHVRADDGQLEQVLLNLSLNARDAMPDGGTLHFAARVIDTHTEQLPPGVVLEPGRYVELVVRDNGTGMDAEVQAHLFEPFFTTKASRGTGLGLPTVYGIVQQCGGAIHVQSELGRGSTFTMFLPEAQHPTPPRGADVIPAIESKRVGRLLLVDDDPDVRTVVARLLERAGHHVVTAEGADDAITIMEGDAEPFDVLITDVTIPGIRGDALAVELVARTPSLRVIFITGDAIRDVSRVQTHERRSVVLRKPFTTSDLEIQLQRALDKS